MDDLISRKAAIEAMQKLEMEDIEAYGVAIPEVFESKRAAEALKALPAIMQMPSGAVITDEMFDFCSSVEKLQEKINEIINSEEPEIIRCKDCKHQEKFFHTDGRRKGGGYYIYGCDFAEGYSHVCLDDDFCSRAERRTE